LALLKMEVIDSLSVPGETGAKVAEKAQDCVGGDKGTGEIRGREAVKNSIYCGS